MPRTGQPATRRIESVQRAIAVLEVLAHAGPELGTNELARRTGINASTVSRLLATLDEGHLVARQPDTGRYRLGVGVMALAGAARQSFDLRSIAHPLLEELAELTGETISLSIPSRRDVITVDFVQSGHSVRSVAEIGRNSIAHATAVGKVNLAWGGELPDGQLRSYTDRTIVDRDTLATHLTEVRERGWATASREREVDLNAVAVPVHGRIGHLVAIFGVQGPALRFTDEAMSAAIEPMLERAELLSAVA